MSQENELPKVREYIKTAEGFALELCWAPMGVVDVPGIEEVVICAHVGAASKMTCWRNDRRYSGTAVHGDIDIIMHAGWPYLQETIALMVVYPQVYADLGAIDWGLRRPEFYAYLSALMRAGFGKRLMFGSDHMYWPEFIGMAVEAIDSATFLTPSEKRDIFYGNAVRFFKLEQVAERKTH